MKQVTKEPDSVLEGREGEMLEPQPSPPSRPLRPQSPRPHHQVQEALLLISLPKKETQLETLVIFNWPTMWRTEKLMVGKWGGLNF